MVVAGVNVFRLGKALRLGVAGGPLHHRAARIGVRWAVEEIVRRGLLGVRVLSGRIGQMSGIGGRPYRYLVLGDETDERLGVAGAPALQRDHAFAFPPLVVGDGVRNFVSIVDGFHVDRRAGDAAVGVDEVDCVTHARTVILADKRRGAGVVGQVAHKHLVLCQGRKRGARNKKAHGHNSPFHLVFSQAATSRAGRRSPPRATGSPRVSSSEARKPRGTPSMRTWQS